MAAKVRERRGIFDPKAAWQWRGATLRIELKGQDVMFAKLRRVHEDHAELEALDPKDCKTVIGQSTLDWPPAGAVTVLRAP
jgi:hypothetical protein